jgi:choline-sulfatase
MSSHARLGDRPNLVLLLTDQQRFDALGCLGDPTARTPNLDRLAAGGVTFRNAYVSMPICIPSRNTVMTGLYPHRIPDLNPPWHTLPEGHWTVAHALRAAGYQTAAIGKMHFHPVHARHGFEVMRIAEHMGFVYPPGTTDDYREWLKSVGRFDWRATHEFGPEQEKEQAEYHRNLSAMPFTPGEEYHVTSWVKRETLSFLRNRDPKRPFFLVSSYLPPHTPLDPPPPYDSMYVPGSIQLPRHTWRANDTLPPALRAAMTQNPFGTPLADRFPEPILRRWIAFYYGLITQIDDAIGEVLQEIDLADTFVVFTSDHGDFLAHRNQLLKSPGIPFDDLAKAPFICAGAGLPAGKMVESPIENADLAPTWLELAGLPSPDGLDGESLLPHFLDSGHGSGRIVFTGSSAGYHMVRRGALKYFLDPDNGEEMLYDLSLDPHEAENRAAEARYRRQKSELRLTLEERLARGLPELPRVGET